MKMKNKFGILIITAIFSILGNYAYAQDKEVQDTTLGWKLSGVTSLTFSQVHFENWSSGGENSYSLNGLLAASADYKTKKMLWDNDINIAYGFMNQNDKDNRKTDDNLEISSKFGYKAVNKWYYSALLGFKTQFAEGFDYDDDAGTRTLISKFMAPAYLNIALGMNYAPNKAFSLFIGPVSGKTTFVKDDTLSHYGAFGVEIDKTVKNEFGGTVKASLQKDIFKNVNLISKLELFSNYMENPGNIDVDLQLLLTLKVNKFLSTNINLHLIYDDDITTVDDLGDIAGPKLQFKELIGVGLTLKF